MFCKNKANKKYIDDFVIFIFETQNVKRRKKAGIEIWIHLFLG